MNYQISSRIKKFDHHTFHEPVIKLAKSSKENIALFTHHSFERVVGYLLQVIHRSQYHVIAWKWDPKKELN